jgi:hypothetical protein
LNVNLPTDWFTQAEIDLSDYATNTALTEGLAKKQDVGDYVTTEQAEETKKALEDEIATKQKSGNYVPYYDAGDDGMWVGSYVSLVAGNHAGSHSIGFIPSSRISGSGGAKVAFRDSNNNTTAWIEESGAMYGFTKGNFTDNNQIVCQAEVDSSIETALESYTTTDGMTETLADYAKTADLADYATAESLETTKAEIEKALENKADVNGGNTDFIYVIETYIDGTEGYRIWSDMYCEQWGKVDNKTAKKTVTLLRQMANTNYTIFATSTYNTGDSTLYQPHVLVTDETSFTVASYGERGTNTNTNGQPVFWLVRGECSPSL